MAPAALRLLSGPADAIDRLDREGDADDPEHDLREVVPEVAQDCGDRGDEREDRPDGEEEVRAHLLVRPLLGPPALPGCDHGPLPRERVVRLNPFPRGTLK